MMERTVQILSYETVHEGFYPKSVLRLRHSLFRGGLSPEVSRDVLELGAASVVLPYDPRTDSILLVEQFRIAPYLMDEEPWLLEAIAGRAEDGEDASVAAAREAREEANIELTALERAGIGYPSPGGLKELTTIFVGRCDLAGVDGGIHGAAGESEDIRVRVITVDEALSMAASGTLRALSALVALYWLALHRADLRRRWA